MQNHKTKTKYMTIHNYEFFDAEEDDNKKLIIRIRMKIIAVIIIIKIIIKELMIMNSILI